MAPEAQTPSQCPDKGELPRIPAYNPLSMKHFHGVWTEDVHEYSLKSRFGKVSSSLSLRDVLARSRQLSPAQSVHGGRVACLLLLTHGSDVPQACLTPRGHGPLAMAFMSCGLDARQ